MFYGLGEMGISKYANNRDARALERAVTGFLSRSENLDELAMRREQAKDIINEVANTIKLQRLKNKKL